MPKANGPAAPRFPTDADLATLVDAHHAACITYAERMLGSRADAEDAVQDTWLRAVRALHRYDSSRPFQPWLFRILINTVRSHLRRRRHWWSRWTDTVDPDSVPASAVEGVAGAGANAANGGDSARLDALRIAVVELPETLREAFLLKYVSNMSYADMEQATGANVSALKMRVKRACDLLRPQLQAQLQAVAREAEHD